LKAKNAWSKIIFSNDWGLVDPFFVISSVGKKSAETTVKDMVKTNKTVSSCIRLLKAARHRRFYESHGHQKIGPTVGSFLTIQPPAKPACKGGNR
jgi:hypothetical protein